MKKLGLNSGYIGSDQRLTTNGIVGYNKLLLERKNGRFSPRISSLLLLNFFPATSAYSLRRLRSNYIGSAIRVRRVSNNDELDIGFNGENLDISTLNSFCAGTDGFATTWYDQQGGNDVTQITAGAQPKIYDSLTGVVLENGKPALDFDGTDYLTNISLVIPQPSTYFIVYRYDDVADIDKTDLIDGSVSRNLIDITTGNYHRMFANTNFISTLSATTSHELSYNLFNSISSQKAINGGIIQTGNAGTGQLEGLLIGARNGLGAKLDGKIQEVIIYNSNQSSNRTDIETNINNYYNIY